VYFKNKRILITGINGFIGKNLSSYLKEELKCAHVFGIVRKENNVDTNIYKVDLTDIKSLEKAILEIRPHIIFHLAANIKPTRDVEDLNDMIQTNIIGTTNILYIIQKNNIQLDSFVNLGSCEEYGQNVVMPFTEELLPSPVSMYSGTKSAAVSLCQMFYNLYKIPIVTVRPSLVYGPFQNDRFFIVQSIKKLLLNEDFDMTMGQQTRDFIYVDDLVKGLVEVSKSSQLRGEIVNISSGSDYKLIDVISKIHKLTESKSKLNIGVIPYRTSEIMSFQCSNKKMLESTEWKPTVCLEEGLLRTIDSLRGGLNR
jgi:nucleoside-diphosphate-sugar epimerase